jgi:hypothetical protein
MLETFDEVIYVDWNSPTHSFLYDVIDLIPKTGRLKHFAIPPEYADMMTMNDPKAQVCNTVLAFNLGIRRTDAEWIVLSTTDIIPPTKEALNDFINDNLTTNVTNIWPELKGIYAISSPICGKNPIARFSQNILYVSSCCKMIIKEQFIHCFCYLKHIFYVY